MANIFSNAVRSLKNAITNTNSDLRNRFNQAFFGYIGGAYTTYDQEASTYLERGYNENSVVYSVIQQMATKTASVPYFVEQVKNTNQLKSFKKHLQTPSPTDPMFQLFKNRLRNKAFTPVENEDFGLPLDRPNELQTWYEFFDNYKTQIRLFGNCYIYMLRPEMGINSGQPQALYILPAHLINIVLKNDAKFLLTESPVGYYTLIEQSYYVKFEADDVIHIKLPNPNFDKNGAHLYGQSPMRAGLKNLESSNEANNQNIKTLKNSGAYGFIHGKQIPLNPAQATELKDRLQEMDASPERLSKIAGISQEIGFTRLSLTTDELKPFDFLNYDQKQICNVLGWSDLLLNSDMGAKYDNIKQVRQRVVTDNIIPDLMLLEHALNDEYLPLYPKFRDKFIYFDASLLPEMQIDQAQMVAWLSIALNDGAINRNEYREALKFTRIEDNEMEVFTTRMGIIPLTEAVQPDMNDEIPLIIE